MTTLFENRQWAVTDYGVECKTYNYDFARIGIGSRRQETKGWVYDWLPHLAEKDWVDLGQFIEAYREAFRIHNIRFSEKAFIRSIVLALRVRRQNGLV